MCCEPDPAGLGEPSRSWPLELPKTPVGQDVCQGRTDAYVLVLHFGVWLLFGIFL